MIKFRKVIILCIFIILLGSGCNDQREVEAIPDLPEFLVPIEQMNKDLDLLIVPKLNHYKLDECVEVLVRLKSKNPVFTKTDGNIEMYLYDDSNREWKQIPDLKDYQNPTSNFVITPPEIKDIILIPGQNGEDGFFVGLYPVIEDYSKSQKLLIVAYGNLYKDGRALEEKIGAYKVVTLNP